MEIIKIKYFRSLKNVALSANATNVLPISSRDIDTHGFFNESVITNVSASDILITPDNNTDKAFIIPAKSNFIWSYKDDNFKYTTLKYTELSGSNVAADKIYFLVIKKRFESVN